MIDFLIVFMYIALVVWIGLRGKDEIRSIKEFSLSTKRYGTFIIMASLSASYIGGGFSTGNASKVAQGGIGNIIALFGFSLGMFLVGKYVVPKMNKYDGMISVGEIIGSRYGRMAQVMTGLFSALVCAGILGAQVGAIGYILNVFFNINLNAAIIIGCAIIMVYSTLGGMKAVVETDILQFSVLALGMPLLLYLSIKACGGVSEVLTNAPAEYFDILNNKAALGFISLALTMALGEILVPPYIQRLLMGKNQETTSKATMYSAILSVPFFIITGLIGLCGYVYYGGSNVDYNAIMQNMINDVAPIGIKALLISSLLSITMSSADSFLNSAAVALVNDVILPLKKKKTDELLKLKLVQYINILIGVFAVVVAIKIPNILDILTFAYSFWSPLILIPLLFLLLDKCISKRGFYITTLSGLVVTVIFKMILNNPMQIDGSIYGVAASLIIYILMYLQNKKRSNINL